MADFDSRSVEHFEFCDFRIYIRNPLRNNNVSTARFVRRSLDYWKVLIDNDVPRDGATIFQDNIPRLVNQYHFIIESLVLFDRGTEKAA